MLDIYLQLQLFFWIFTCNRLQPRRFRRPEKSPGLKELVRLHIIWLL